MDSFNLPGVDLKEYFNRLQFIGDVVRAGTWYALGEDWKTVDEVIAPAYERRLTSLLKGEGETNGWQEGFTICRDQLLTSKDSRVRDFGATILDSYFRVERPSLASLVSGAARDPRTSKDSVVEALIKVALQDRELWPRVRASMALISAYQLAAQDLEHPVDYMRLIEKKKMVLSMNLAAGFREDPSLSDKLAPYFSVLDRMAHQK